MRGEGMAQRVGAHGLARARLPCRSPDRPAEGIGMRMVPSCDVTARVLREFASRKHPEPRARLACVRILPLQGKRQLDAGPVGATILRPIRPSAPKLFAQLIESR